MTDKSLEARWGDDMLDGGFTVVPNLILDALPRLGITDEESLFIIHVFRFKRDERNPYPKVRTLARTMGKSERTIQSYMRSLEGKGCLERKYRENDSSELDFSGLLDAVRDLRGVKNPAPPATSCTPGVNGSAPPPVQGPASKKRNTSKAGNKKGKKKPVLQPPVQTSKSNGGEVSKQVESSFDEEDRFLDSLQEADKVEGIYAIQEHWRMNAENGRLPAKTAAYWLFAHPKGCWDHLEKHGLEKATKIIKSAMDEAFERNRRGKINDLIGYLNDGIQAMNPYLIHE